MVEELISLHSMHVGFVPSVYCSTATTVRVHSFQLDQNAHKKFPRDLKTVLNNTHLCTSVHNNTLSVAHLQIQTFSHSLEQKKKKMGTVKYVMANIATIPIWKHQQLQKDIVNFDVLE